MLTRYANEMKTVINRVFEFYYLLIYFVFLFLTSLGGIKIHILKFVEMSLRVVSLYTRRIKYFVSYLLTSLLTLQEVIAALSGTRRPPTGDKENMFLGKIT